MKICPILYSKSEQFYYSDWITFMQSMGLHYSTQSFDERITCTVCEMDLKTDI